MLDFKNKTVCKPPQLLYCSDYWFQAYKVNRTIQTLGCFFNSAVIISDCVSLNQPIAYGSWIVVWWCSSSLPARVPADSWWGAVEEGVTSFLVLPWLAWPRLAHGAGEYLSLIRVMFSKTVKSYWFPESISQENKAIMIGLVSLCAHRYLLRKQLLRSHEKVKSPYSLYLSSD